MVDETFVRVVPGSPLPHSVGPERHPRWRWWTPWRPRTVWTVWQWRAQLPARGGGYRLHPVASYDDPHLAHAVAVEYSLRPITWGMYLGDGIVEYHA